MTKKEKQEIKKWMNIFARFSLNIGNATLTQKEMLENSQEYNNHRRIKRNKKKMILNKSEIQFLKKFQRIIEPMLKKRIEEYKNLILEEEDEEKRDKLIKWVKEFRVGLGVLYQADKDKKDEFTGI